MPATERVLDFSIGGAKLASSLDRLAIRREEADELCIPFAEIGAVVLGSPRLTVTHPALAGLAAANAAVVVCDSDGLPVGMLMPLAAHTWQTQRMLSQAAAALPLRKRLWQAVVRAKVRAQASVLRLRSGDDAGLPELARRVRSGDPDNIEAQAAQRYWPRVFAHDAFLRRRDAPDQNRLLNYGYAVLRAAVARSVCAAGLHPSLGVHHRSRSNPFCLADDLMEPYRPLVDAEVAEIVGESGFDTPLSPAVKARLVGAVHAEYTHAGERRVLTEWIQRSAASLARNLCGEREPLFFPEALFDP